VLGGDFGVVVRYALERVGRRPRRTAVSSLEDVGDRPGMRESLGEAAVAFGGLVDKLADDQSLKGL
jgi:hypothetical protein